jgi:hypothetical protein
MKKKVQIGRATEATPWEWTWATVGADIVC